MILPNDFRKISGQEYPGVEETRARDSKASNIDVHVTAADQTDLIILIQNGRRQFFINNVR